MIFAAVSYTAAEVAVTQTRLYRYGIEKHSPSVRLLFCA